MDEAIAALEKTGIHLDTLRVRAYPFADEVLDFIRDHEHIFLVEQNRDAQMRTLLLDTGRIVPAKIVPVLHYDGTPITAHFIVDGISRRIQEYGRVSIRVVAS
jgi:2-oxoglutarate ferredoxin oxidoreductase subunit alpha